MNEKKNIKRKIVLLLFIGVLVYLLISVGVWLVRRNNILKELESVYVDADFVSIKCKFNPVDKEEEFEGYRWFGDGLPEDTLYKFYVIDSEGNLSLGYATRFGKVVFDNYCAAYYHDECVEYFNETIDFEQNFPMYEYEFYVAETSLMERVRMVSTQDCRTFEGYMTATTVGYNPWRCLGTGGFPGLLVGVKVPNDTLQSELYELFEEIENIFYESEFTLFIQFRDVNYATYDVDIIANGYLHDNFKPFPFPTDYGEAILGE